MKTKCWLLLILAFSACTSAPYSGRKQLMLLPSSQLGAMGTQAFDAMLQQTPTNADPEVVNYVKCVTQPIVDTVALAHKDEAPKEWRLAVMQDPTPNAFALPGGNIGVNVGLLKVAKNEDQLATVIGHELGHVIANHGGERISQTLLAQGGLALTQGLLLRNMPEGNRNMLMAALGLGTQVGLLLPFGRKQETEADVIGVHLMAKAGFDPRQSVELWKNMIAANDKGSPPQFLSTHPSSENRIEKLNAEIPGVMADYQKAVQTRDRSPASEGKCIRPDEKKIEAAKK